MLYNIHWRARPFDTRIHTYENLTRSWRANIYVYRRAAETTLTWSTVRSLPQDEDRCFMAGTITLFTFFHHQHLPIWNLQSENIGSRGWRPYTSLFFLISTVSPRMASSLNFLPTTRETQINRQFFFSSLADPRFGFFGRRKTRFHLLGRSVHPIDAFETGPSVLCQSQSPSWHITQTVIHYMSFFYLPKEYDEKSVILT